MNSSESERHLRSALALARSARGDVAPRPPVGAVIVKDGRVVGEGKTEPRPGLHAEVAALKAAGAAAVGATMYCTLEPHAHQGVAAPCTEEMIAAGITRLVCPIEDPNPAVNGNGFRRLRSAGVEVVTDAPEEIVRDATEVISGFTTLTLLGRPQFTLKYAMSLDGRIATSTGESKWITGEEARAEAHRLRNSCDAIITGIGTVLADNPRMTARNADGTPIGRPRLRVVLDTKGRMPPGSALLQEPGKVLWIVGESIRRPEVGGDLEVVSLPEAGGRVDVGAVARLLAERELCDVLVEAGGNLAGAFVAAGLIDRVAAFIGPAIVGGTQAPGPVAGPGFGQLANALRLEDIEHTRLGADLLVTGRVRRV